MLENEQQPTAVVCTPANGEICQPDWTSKNHCASRCDQSVDLSMNLIVYPACTDLGLNFTTISCGWIRGNTFASPTATFMHARNCPQDLCEADEKHIIAISIVFLNINKCFISRAIVRISK